ncbi:uncharacterized protein [Euwallacea similis]|uniref:uncharacterized protein isoform X4 n=1 Tax=Euwallacea similis TaxID=1736056 RepID=UPI003450E657
MDLTAFVYLATVIVILLGLGVILRFSCKESKESRRRRRENGQGNTGNNVRRTIEFIDCSLPDDNGIYNISSRVQGQQSQYPDAYLSVDHITISNELNKPPKYDDAPPSYEEAVKLAMAHSNSIQTFQAEQVNNTRPQAHSSTTTTVVVPAVAGQSTE